MLSDVSIDVKREYPFEEFVYIMRGYYSRDYIVNQMMQLLVPVKWRRGMLLVDGRFVYDLLNKKITL